PKCCPPKAINFKTPSTQTEDLYINSVDATLQTYKRELEALKAGNLHLPDVNFDTSETTRAVQYKLTDEAYPDSLGKLADKHFDHVNPALRDDMLHFYDNLNAPIETKRH